MGVDNDDDDDFGDFVVSAAEDNDHQLPNETMKKKEEEEEESRDSFLGIVNITTTISMNDDERNVHSQDAAAAAAASGGENSPALALDDEPRDDGIIADTTNHLEENGEEFWSTRTEEDSTTFVLENNHPSENNNNTNYQSDMDMDTAAVTNTDATTTTTTTNPTDHSDVPDRLGDIITAEPMDDSFGDFGSAHDLILEQNETETIDTQSNTMIPESQVITMVKDTLVETQISTPINNNDGGVSDNLGEMEPSNIIVKEEEEEGETTGNADENVTTTMQQSKESADHPDSTLDMAEQNSSDIHVVKCTDTENVPEDDDFGDFDAAPVHSAAEPVDIDEDDDFGDFDEAPTIGTWDDTARDVPCSEEQETLDTAPPKTKPTTEYEFGDFREAAVTAEVDDDFGDFDEAPTTAPEPSNINEIPSSYTNNVVEKAAAMLPIVFGQYRSKPENAEDTDPRTIPEAKSIENILATLGEQKYELPSEEERIQILGNLLEKNQQAESQPPTLIISKGAMGPFAHTYYPTGGFSRRKKSIPTTLTSWETYLPSSSKTPSSDPASSDTNNQRQKHSSSTATSKPSTKGGEVLTKLKSEENGSLDRVKEFLSRVPDLSFMLSTKLSIPEAS